MLRINRQTDYAFRIILFLAKHPPGTRISSSKIRDKMLIPPALSPRIVAELARGKLIETFPGRDGGIQLARKSEEISMWDIIDLFEGPVYLSDCMVDEGQACPFENHCPIHLRWAPLQDVLRKELQKITFHELALDAKKLEALPRFRSLSSGGESIQLP